MIGRLSSIGRDESGNSFVEMALVTPVLAALLVGTVDISRAVSAKVQLEQAAQRTIELIQATDFKTEQASVFEADAEAAAGDGSDADVDAWLECDHDGQHLDFDDDSCAPGQTYARYVRVDVENSFTPMFASRFFPGANPDGTITVSGHAVVRVQ